MTTDTEHQNDLAHNLEEIAEIGSQTLQQLSQPAIETLTAVNEQLYEGISEINLEWARFMNRRLKEDLAMPQTLMCCRSVSEVYSTYSDFWLRMMQQYQSETAKLMQMSAALAMTSMRPHKSGGDGARTRTERK